MPKNRPSERPKTLSIYQRPPTINFNAPVGRFMRRSHGYRVKDLVKQFNAKPAEIRALFANQLDPTRTAELRAELQMAGLPI